MLIIGDSLNAGSSYTFAKVIPKINKRCIAIEIDVDLRISKRLVTLLVLSIAEFIKN